MRSMLISVIPAMVLGIGAIGASPCIAQTRLTSLEELRRALVAGDVVTVVAAGAQPVSGRLMRLSDTDLDVRRGDRRNPGDPAARDITIPLTSIQSLERFRDPVRNGTAIGAGIGAGFGGAMFISALVVDRNEVDEWAGVHIGAAALFTGVGALVGWAIDSARSRPHIRYEAPGGKAISLTPVFSRGRGIAVAVSFRNW